MEKSWHSKAAAVVVAGSLFLAYAHIQAMRTNGHMDHMGIGGVCLCLFMFLGSLQDAIHSSLRSPRRQRVLQLLSFVALLASFAAMVI